MKRGASSADVQLLIAYGLASICLPVNIFGRTSNAKLARRLSFYSSPKIIQKKFSIVLLFVQNKTRFEEKMNETEKIPQSYYISFYNTPKRHNCTTIIYSIVTQKLPDFLLFTQQI